MWRPLVLAVVFLAGAGCSLVATFDDESQPCELNAPAGQECKEGYRCVLTSPEAGLCKRLDGTSPEDGGSDDAGAADAGAVEDAGSADDAGVDAGP